MKKLIAVLLLACLACLGVSAQSPHMQVGFTFEYDHYNFTDTLGGSTFTDDRGNLAIGVFLDAAYLRAIVEYQRAVSGTQTLTGYVPYTYDSFDVSFINAIALLKYPFQFGTTTFWPAAGVRYSHPLSYTIGGVDYMSSSALSVADFYLCFGGGVDFRTGGVIVGFSALFDYNLTPSQTNLALPPGEQVWGSDFQVALNVGFPL